MILGQEYQVVLAESGLEALNKLQEEEEQIDMVLLDIDMPEMNGIETFERMKDFAADTLESGAKAAGNLADKLRD